MNFWLQKAELRWQASLNLTTDAQRAEAEHYVGFFSWGNSLREISKKVLQEVQ